MRNQNIIRHDAAETFLKSNYSAVIRHVVKNNFFIFLLL